MNALESPLEALAFNCLSFDFFTVVINNVWTWVAVFSAALSFWRIKTSTSSTLPRGDFSTATSLSPPPVLATSMSSSPVERVSSSQKAAATLSTSEESSLFATLGDVSKGKLTVYFKQDDGGESCDGERVGMGGVETLCKEWFENWEKTLKMRKGEMGWYCYQDMRVIDGNVVKLWDGCRRRRKAQDTAFSVGIVRAW